MARILLAGPPGLASRPAMTALVQRLEADGHDSAWIDAPASDAIQEADAVVAVLDPLTPHAAAAVAAAHALHKPVLGLAGDDGVPDWVETACDRVQRGRSLQATLEGLPAFYDRIRPFAGRLVRDLVPQLVREAGYDVSFRAVDTADRPRFLKQKVLDEARQLLAAEAGAEKEEVADLLEALETLIRVRDYGRDALKQVKEAKHKRRGGFERGWVVESTAGSAPRDGEGPDGREAEEAPDGPEAADSKEDVPHAPRPGGSQDDQARPEATDDAREETRDGAAARPTSFFEA